MAKRRCRSRKGVGDVEVDAVDIVKAKWARPIVVRGWRIFVIHR